MTQNLLKIEILLEIQRRLTFQKRLFEKLLAEGCFRSMESSSSRYLECQNFIQKIFPSDFKSAGISLILKGKIVLINLELSTSEYCANYT